MKDFTVFESSVIGFFIGVVAATYVAFVDSTGGYLGGILNWVSWHPVSRMLLGALSITENNFLTAGFIFTVVVFSCYGLIAGIIIKKNKKAKYVIIGVAALFAVGIFFQQVEGSAQISATEGAAETAAEMAAAGALYPTIETPVRPVHPANQILEQYFGNEVVGDLNGDGKNDVAFILSRDDKVRGTLYYLSTALAVDNGHVGTNLIYLGEKIDLESISIDHGIIGVSYFDRSSNASSTVYAKITNGKLESVKAVDAGKPVK
jgi:hypothetical protein